MRNIRVLLVASDPGYGTDWYRATGPFSKIDGVEIVRPEKGRFSWETIADVDVVFIQRPALPLNVHMIELCKKYKKPVLLDYDDDPTCLNKDNPVYDIWTREDKQTAVKACVQQADITIASTQSIKDSLQALAPKAKIVLVPNAIDDSLFSMQPYSGPRNKIIVLRGGSSHVNDWLDYKDGILKILKAYPDYKLAVMGYHPAWLDEIKSEQLMLFEMSDVVTYFDTLMQLRPQYVLVPLSDNKFNRGKSPIGIYEGVLAGATAIATSLPEFFITGVAKMTNSEELFENFALLEKEPGARNLLYETCLSHMPRLYDWNQQRKRILKSLLANAAKYEPIEKTAEVYTDLEFYEYAQSHGHTQEDPAFKKMHCLLAEWFVKKVNPKTAVEYGAGTGGTLVELLKQGVMATGIEINPHFIEYFKENHPMFANQMIEMDITKEQVEPSDEETCDLGYSIEVFEHINMPEEWWKSFIEQLAKTYKHFYFTSTPYRGTEAFEKQWGHINVRRESDWKKLFTDNGFEFVSNPKVIVGWDQFYKSKLI